jgi:hypothetical protein
MAPLSFYANSKHYLTQLLSRQLVLLRLKSSFCIRFQRLDYMITKANPYGVLKFLKALAAGVRHLRITED